MRVELHRRTGRNGDRRRHGDARLGLHDRHVVAVHASGASYERPAGIRTISDGGRGRSFDPMTGGTVDHVLRVAVVVLLVLVLLLGLPLGLPMSGSSMCPDCDLGRPPA